MELTKEDKALFVYLAESTWKGGFVRSPADGNLIAALVNKITAEPKVPVEI